MKREFDRGAIVQKEKKQNKTDSPCNMSKGVMRQRQEPRKFEEDKARERWIKNSGSEGARERGSEGARERGSEGARERGSEGARERGSEGARERGSESFCKLQPAESAQVTFSFC